MASLSPQGLLNWLVLVVTTEPNRFATEEELSRYLASPAFRRRAKRLQKRIIGGEKLSFDQMAAELRLPLDVVIGGFQHSMAKAGHPVRPIGRVN